MKRQRTISSRSGQSQPPGKLRIIGGDFRRRQLPVLHHPGLRPTPDRVRETLFNWLGQQLYGRRVLDLFAGTGALGIEALSRGATSVTFVERDAKVAAQIGANLATLRTDQGQVVTTDTLSYLTQPILPPGFTPVDLVFLDPPFYQDLAALCCQALEAHAWLASQAMIYVETESSYILDTPSNWQLHRETRAGDSTARLYLRLP